MEIILRLMEVYVFEKLRGHTEFDEPTSIPISNFISFILILVSFGKLGRTKDLSLRTGSDYLIVLDSN